MTREHQVALCIGEEERCNPELVGLEGERFDSASWLEVFTSGETARAALAERKGISKVWVVSSDDVEPINLAATIKEDRPDLFVSLVDPRCEGSLMSRAYSAGIDEVVGPAPFVRSYAAEKEKMTRLEDGEEERPSNLHADDGSATRNASNQPLPQAKPAKRRLALAAPTHARAFLLPVVSGSGGAGKSAVSVMGAYISAAAGYRTLLLDYDLQFGDMAALSGVTESLALDIALERPDLLDRMVDSDAGLSVLAAPTRLELAEDVVKAFPDLLADVESRFDVIVANTGAAWAEQHALLLERSNAALFLVDQRTSSIRACKHALELCSRCGIATGPFKFALNRCAKGAPLTGADVSSALKDTPVFEIKDGGREVEEFLGVGAASELVASGNEFCLSLASVLARILPDGERNMGNLEAAHAENKSSKKRGKHANRWLARRSL